MDNLNRRVLASESLGGLRGNSTVTSGNSKRPSGSGGGGGHGGEERRKTPRPSLGSGLVINAAGEAISTFVGRGRSNEEAEGGGSRKALHQRPLTMKEIQAGLAPHIEAQVKRDIARYLSVISTCLIVSNLSTYLYIYLSIRPSIHLSIYRWRMR